MALQTWLPLIRDTNNQGLTDSTINNYNSGATPNTAGKLGGCYSFDGTNDLLSGTSPPLNNDTDEWSFCAWVNFSTMKNAGLFSNRSATGTTGIIIVVQSTGKILIDDGVRWTVTPNTTFTTNTWYHICVVRKKGVGKYLYINGILDSSTTTTGTPTIASPTRFMVGALQKTSTTVDSSYYFNGKLNDVRVYDHALSKKEVAEIAKGLVVHFPLNGNGRAGDNLLSNSIIDSSTSGWGRAGTDWVSSGIVNAEGTPKGKALRVTYNGTAGGVRGGIYHTLTAGTSVFSEGDKYTITAMLRASVDCQIRFYDTLSSTATEVITTEWKIYTKTQTVTNPTANGRVQMYMQPSYVTTGAWIECAMVKMEKGDKATPWMPYSVNSSIYTRMGYDSTTELDTSGFKYNAAKLGTVAYDTDTPRYSVCTKFNGTDTVLNCGHDFHVQQAKNMSVNVWGYCEDWTTSTIKYLISSQQTGGMCLSYRSGTTIRGRFHVYTADDLSTTAYKDADYAISLTTGWHMFTTTLDESSVKTYVDGNLVKTTSATNYGIHFNNTASTFIGAECAGASTASDYFNGKISDVRIYYTTLTADQVKELYNSPVSISKNGKLLTKGEVIER